jgi:D-psicose/D-tagatose/L-ribulose 3-epimerase
MWKNSMQFSLCNEVFEGWTWADTVRVIAEAGYDGVEIAPFTLTSSVADLSPAERATLRRQAEDVGLEVVGLHWLFVTPKGLHATTDDALTRQRTTAYLQELIRFCSDLGGKAMIIGSPQQRNVQQGVAYEVAWGRFVDMIAACVDLAAEREVMLCMEALPGDQSNFVTSLAEAVRMVQQVDHPNFQTMFDVHNAHLEQEPLPDLVRRYMPYIRHVHVNEMDGGYPGSGNFDFGSILRVLQEENFQGYVSAEVFDYSPGAEFIARETIRYLRSVI